MARRKITYIGTTEIGARDSTPNVKNILSSLGYFNWPEELYILHNPELDKVICHTIIATKEEGLTCFLTVSEALHKIRPGYIVTPMPLSEVCSLALDFGKDCIICITGATYEVLYLR